MPISHKSFIGYGFLLDVESAITGISGYDERLDDLEYELSTNYPLLELKYSGDSYTGEGQQSWLMVKDSVVQIWDEWEIVFSPEGLQESITDAAMEELFSFTAEFGIVVGNAEWRLLRSVG